MDVVFHAADFDGLHLVLPCDATQERPESFAQCRGDEAAALFSAECAMEIGTDVGHADHSAVPSGPVQCGKHPGVETPGYSQDVPSGQSGGGVAPLKGCCCGDVTAPLSQLWPSK